MNKCKTCQFFKSSDSLYFKNGKCLNEDVNEEVRVSGFDEDGVVFSEEFGCIHHKEKL